MKNDDRIMSGGQIAQIRIAKKLKYLGVDPDIISKATGLKIYAIEQLPCDSDGKSRPSNFQGNGFNPSVSMPQIPLPPQREDQVGDKTDASCKIAPSQPQQQINSNKQDNPNNDIFSHDGLRYKITSKDTCELIGFEEGSEKEFLEVSYDASRYKRRYRITSIGECAFEGCTKIKKVNIINASIGDAAFRNCSNLKKVTTRFSEEIGNYAFQGCEKLEEVEFSNQLKSVGEKAFSHCKSLTSIVLQDFINRIAPRAFEYCDHLTTAILYGDEMQTLECETFSHCPQLKSVHLPYGLQEIKERAFEHCDALTQLMLPPSCQKIDSSAFDGEECQCEKFSPLEEKIAIGSEEKDSRLYDLVVDYPKGSITNPFTYKSGDACYFIYLTNRSIPFSMLMKKKPLPDICDPNWPSEFDMGYTNLEIYKRCFLLYNGIYHFETWGESEQLMLLFLCRDKTGKQTKSFHLGKDSQNALWKVRGMTLQGFHVCSCIGVILIEHLMWH
ncbi:MAG: leucine-rich repeat domain-containing protein [Paludibacteraceae bacterium]|nr:leucine-rich repeat domain-containing protein [Paludibacteraceae bacterium]